MTRLIYFSRDYTSHDYRFLSALAQTEYKVYYVTLERRGHMLEDRSLPPEIVQVNWSGGKKPFLYKDLPRLQADLKRLINQIKPDLIQAGPLQTAAFLVALTGYQPLLSMSWGYDLLQDANRNAFYRWVTRYTLHRSTGMLGDCNTIRRRAIDFGMLDDQIVTFPWGIDLDHFTISSHLMPGNQFTMLSTRSWEPVYGVDIIARAFVQIAQRFERVNLVMLGNGSQAGLLRKIFLDGGVLERVSFPGQVSYASLPRYYRSANLYVTASHSDGTSISLLEAMGCGLPVLVSDIPGNQEWITPGVQGWLFSDGSVQALAEGMAQAISQAVQLPGMGHSARQLAEERADWGKNFLVLLKAYDMVLKRA